MKSKTELESLEDVENTFGPMVAVVSENIRALVLMLQEVVKVGGKNEVTPEQLLRRACERYIGMNAIGSMGINERKRQLDYVAVMLMGQIEWEDQEFPTTEYDYKKVWYKNLEPWAVEIMYDLKDVQDLLIWYGGLAEDMINVVEAGGMVKCVRRVPHKPCFYIAPWAVVLVATKFGNDTKPQHNGVDFKRLSAEIFKLGAGLAMRQGWTVHRLVFDILGLKWRNEGGELLRNKEDDYLEWKVG